MRDIIIGQAKGLSAQWRKEATARRRRASLDVAADTLASCADELPLFDRRKQPRTAIED